MNPLVTDISTPLFFTPREFADRLRSGVALLVLDVRPLHRFNASDRQLPRAQYCLPVDVPAFAAAHAPQAVLVYCVYGHEVSQQAAAILRAAGWPARYLLGGIEGGEPGVDDAAWMVDLQTQALPTVAKV